jgi:hypothetical protein
MPGAAIMQVGKHGGIQRSVDKNLSADFFEHILRRVARCPERRLIAGVNRVVTVP